MNPDQNSSKAALLIAGLVAMAAYLYVLLRAYYVPPFCDEVITFFDYIRPGDLQPFYARLDANNHVINSALSRVFYLLFGEGIFVLRLANVLAFALYLSYLLRFRTFFKDQWLWLAFFIALVVPQFFLDFFHLSRGYGLSMAFMMGAFYHLLSYHGKARFKDFVVGLLFMSLALWSNLSLTLTTLLYGLCLLYLWLIKHRGGISRSAHLLNALSFLALLAAPLLVAIQYGFALKDAGMLYYGAESGFWDKSIIMTAKWIAGDWILGGVLVINSLIAYLLLVGYNLRHRKPFKYLEIHFLLWSSIIGILLMHHLLGVKLPVDRATLHLFLLFTIGLFLLMDASENNLARHAGFALAAFLTYNTLADTNLSRTRLWFAEHVPSSYYNVLLEWKQERGYAPHVSAHGLHQLVLRYHDYLNDGQLTLEDEPVHPQVYADFVLTRMDNEWPRQADYDTVYFDQKTRNGLLQLRHELNWIPIHTVYKVKPNSVEGYSGLGTFDVTAFQNGPVSLTTEFQANSPSEMRNWQLVYTVVGSDGNRSSYHHTGLELTHPNLKETKLIRSRCLIENIPNDAKEILVFVWNVKQVPLEIRESKVILHLLSE